MMLAHSTAGLTPTMDADRTAGIPKPADPTPGIPAAVLRTEEKKKKVNQMLVTNCSIIWRTRPPFFSGASFARHPTISRHQTNMRLTPNLNLIYPPREIHLLLPSTPLTMPEMSLLAPRFHNVTHAATSLSCSAIAVPLPHHAALKGAVSISIYNPLLMQCWPASAPFPIKRPKALCLTLLGNTPFL